MRLVLTCMVVHTWLQSEVAHFVSVSIVSGMDEGVVMWAVVFLMRECLLLLKAWLVQTLWNWYHYLQWKAWLVCFELLVWWYDGNANGGHVEIIDGVHVEVID